MQRRQLILVKGLLFVVPLVIKDKVNNIRITCSDSTFYDQFNFHVECIAFVNENLESGRFLV